MSHTDAQYNFQEIAPTEVEGTRLISIVSKPIKLTSGQTNFDEKIVQKNMG